MQNRAVGTHVFPTKRSDVIRDSPGLLHYGSISKGSSSRIDPKIEDQNSRNASDSINNGPPLFHYSSGTNSKSGTVKSNRSTGFSQTSKASIHQPVKKTNENQHKSLHREQNATVQTASNPPVPTNLKAAGPEMKKQKDSKSLEPPKVPNTQNAVQSQQNERKSSVRSKTSNASKPSNTKKVEESKIPNPPEAPELPKSFEASSVRSKKSNASKASNTKKTEESKIPNPPEAPEPPKPPEILKIPESLDLSSKNQKILDTPPLSEPNLRHSPAAHRPSSAFQEKQKIIAAVIQQQPLPQYLYHTVPAIHRKSVGADGAAKEILKDLDSALESDEHMSIREIRHDSMKIRSTSEDSLGNSGPSVHKCEPVQSAYKSKDNKRHYEIISNKDGTTVAITEIDQIVQELKKLPDGVKSLKEYKQEQKLMIAQREQELEEEIVKAKDACTFDKYIDQVPEFTKGTTTPIPPWKRQMLARKLANEDAQRKEDELRKEFQKWKEQFNPTFRKTVQ